MSDSVTFDTSNLRKFAEELAGAGRRLSTQIPRVIKKGANNIKTDAKDRIMRQARASRTRIPAYPNAISYDMTQTATRVEAEIGPDKSKRQGALGNLLEYGSSHNSPLPHLGPAFEAEVPKTEAALADAAAGAVLSR